MGKNEKSVGTILFIKNNLIDGRYPSTHGTHHVLPIYTVFLWGNRQHILAAVYACLKPPYPSSQRMNHLGSFRKWLAGVCWCIMNDTKDAKNG